MLALALACVGIYGVLAYSVAQRTREIGIRVALGASPTSAFGVVVREGLQLTVIGLAIGVGAATMLARFLRGLLFEVQPLDPVAFASVIALLAIVAGAACAVPASRASWIDPATVLRHE